MYNNVAIILVNYNGWRDTIECLYSLEKINYPHFDVIVVDNKSTDDSVIKLEEYEKTTKITFCLIKHPENVGFAGGNNIGLQYAFGRRYGYYLFLNNDTIVDPNFLDELLKPFSCTGVGATIGEIYYAYDRNRVWYAGGILDESHMKPIHERFNQEEAQHKSEKREVSFATGCCLCCKDECIRKVGGWSEEFFLYEEDVNLSLRIRRAGYKIIYNSDAMIYHKVSASTEKISGLSQVYQVRNRMILIDKYLQGSGKIKAVFYTYLLFANRIRKKEYAIRSVLEGLRAYREHETGRHKSEK